MLDLSAQRLVYIAPREGVGGVGDYAQDFLDAVAPLFGEVVEHRHGPPGEATARDLAEHRRAVRRLVDDGLAQGAARVVVHGECSGGAMVPFWASPAPDQRVLTSVTVHDPPELVWWPGRTRLLARHRPLQHAVHLPMIPVSRRLERRVSRGRHLFALTRIGAEALAREHPRAHAHHTAHLVPVRPDLPPPTARPLAVGLFGHVYRGKGFETLRSIRAALPDEIAVRVAGRGTEDLPRVEGIEVLGEVDGAAEAAFFASIRALLLPYGSRGIYGHALPGSGALTRGLAFQTPSICSDHGALVEVGSDGGGVVAPGGPEALARVAAAVVTDEQRLARLGDEARALRDERAPGRVADRFAEVWSRTPHDVLLPRSAPPNNAAGTPR